MSKSFDKLILLDSLLCYIVNRAVDSTITFASSNIQYILYLWIPILAG